MKHLFLIFLISICSTAIAQKTVKYLPSKFVSMGDTCKFEYDNLNRILTQKTITPNSGSVSRVYYLIYTYSDTDNFTYQEDTYLLKNDSIIDFDSELKKYEKHGSNFTCSKVSTSPQTEGHCIDNRSDVNVETNSNGLVTLISFLLPNKSYTTTTFGYDSLQRIDTMKQVYKDEDNNQEYYMYLKYETHDINKGVFRDVNFTPITKTLQAGNLSFIIANEVPKDILISINKDSKLIGKTTDQSEIKINYTFNENGYVKSVVLKADDKDKEDKILVSDIEYIKVVN